MLNNTIYLFSVFKYLLYKNRSIYSLMKTFAIYTILKTTAFAEREREREKEQTKIKKFPVHPCWQRSSVSYLFLPNLDVPP